jgi:hypothetical protein
MDLGPAPRADARSGAAVRPDGEKISELLRLLADRVGETITLRDLLDGFGERALGALLVVFAAPLVLPMPPGVSAVLGLPLLLFSAQFMLGMRRPWLPRLLAERTIRGRDVVAMVGRVVPLVLGIERLLHPRLGWLAHGPFARLVGALTFVLAVIVFLPVPFGNMLPSLAIAVLGLGLVERDGLALLVGSAVAGASLALLAWLGHVIFDVGVGLLAVAGGVFA